MTKISLETIQQLRERTGAGMMDCKKALEESQGDMEQAITILRKRGAAIAAKRAEHATAEGVVHAYIHPGSRIGVLIEVNCETDFVARTKDVQQLVADLCLHIAASKPLYLNPEQVDPKFLEHEKDILKSQLASSGKPEKILAQIVEGKVQKLYSEICLMNQQFVKNDQVTIDELIKETMAKVGEKIVVKRFSRFEIGA